MIKTLSFIVCSTMVFVGASGPSRAQADASARIDSLRGVWTVALGFGEIPVLANSFKLSVSTGYHFNDYVYLGGILQFPDVIERGSESFNARNLGLGGLSATRERTGVRALLHTRARPHRYAPFLSAGILVNGADAETMYFEGVTVIQTRSSAVRPAVGIGYEVTFKRGITASIEFVGAFFLKPRRPGVEVTADGMSDDRRATIVQVAQDTFSQNFHNRYHLFNMAIGYAW
jgi:hypothetical protein